MARIQRGQRILDIAAGAGEPAVSAAGRVGPDGYVLATDISEGIVELARQAARERRLEQIETRAMDGEKLDLPDASFDAVLCRLGLRYMPHPVTAPGKWRRLLSAGGRVAVVVPSTPDRNGWGAVPASIIRRRARLPPPVPGQPGPFCPGGPGVPKPYGTAYSLPESYAEKIRMDCESMSAGFQSSRLSGFCRTPPSISFGIRLPLGTTMSQPERPVNGSSGDLHDRPFRHFHDVERPVPFYGTLPYDRGS